MVSPFKLYGMIGAGLALLALIGALVFFVQANKNLNLKLDALDLANKQLTAANVQNQETIKDLGRQAAYNEGAARALQKEQAAIGKAIRDAQGKVNREDTGAASDALVCAVTGVCGKSDSSDTDEN